MDKRKKYFVKQKLIGVGVMAFGIASIFLMGDATAAFFLIPIGIGLAFTKQMVWMDDYYWELEAEKRNGKL